MQRREKKRGKSTSIDKNKIRKAEKRVNRNHNLLQFRADRKITRQRSFPLIFKGENNAL